MQKWHNWAKQSHHNVYFDECSLKIFLYFTILTIILILWIRKSEIFEVYSSTLT